MNKESILVELQNKLNISENEAIIINDVLENHNIVGQNNRKKIIADLIDKLNVDEERADQIYNTSMSIIMNKMKNRIFHPFKSSKKES